MGEPKPMYDGLATGNYDPDTFAYVMGLIGAQRVDTRKWEDPLERIYFVNGVAVRIKADYRHTNAVATVTLFGDAVQVGEVEKMIKESGSKPLKPDTSPRKDRPFPSLDAIGYPTGPQSEGALHDFDA